MVQYLYFHCGMGPWTKSFLQLIQLVGIQNIQRNIVMKTKEKYITNL